MAVAPPGCAPWRRAAAPAARPPRAAGAGDRRSHQRQDRCCHWRRRMAPARAAAPMEPRRGSTAPVAGSPDHSVEPPALFAAASGWRRADSVTDAPAQRRCSDAAPSALGEPAWHPARDLPTRVALPRTIQASTARLPETRRQAEARWACHRSPTGTPRKSLADPWKRPSRSPIVRASFAVRRYWWSPDPSTRSSPT